MIATALREFCDSSKGRMLPLTLCIQTHNFSVHREGTTRGRKCSFYLIHREGKQPDESTLNVLGRREQWQNRYNDAFVYCRSIPPSPIVELQALANARVEQVNALFREEERKALAARQEEEGRETAITAQDPRERALDMLRVY